MHLLFKQYNFFFSNLKGNPIINQSTNLKVRQLMQVKIYKPSKTSMQSGLAKTKKWRLEYEKSSKKFIDPTMGWVGTEDTQGLVSIDFESKESAIKYAEGLGLTYKVEEQKSRKHIIRKGGYGENFSFKRKTAWTH